MIIGASVLFFVVALRAAPPVVWAQVRQPVELPIYLHLRSYASPLVFDRYLARLMDHGSLHAALEHERTHSRHRDPLCINLAQLATGLQRPWRWPEKRFQPWLKPLEHASDDEARSHGASGADLATAVIATARYARRASRRTLSACLPGGRAALLGNAHSIALRVDRLLAPLSESHWVSKGSTRHAVAALALLVLLLCAVLVWGAAFGTDIFHPFLLWIWNA